MKTHKLCLILMIIFLSGCAKKCDDYSIDACPKSCVVCPPCAVCSSISCHTKEFCRDLGFNRSWYGDIVFRLQSYVEIGSQRIDVEVADTDKERQKGLMYREGLCADCGMLFVYEKDFRPVFWMKNTMIPLDMVFINSSNQIVDVLHAVPCVEDPCIHYSPKQDSQYVLETNLGRFNESIIGEKAVISVG